jgi:cell division protein FtsN
MAQRDYKPRAGTGNAKKKNAGGTLVGIVIGLLLGLLVAATVAFYLNRGPKPFADKTGRGEKAAAAAKGANDTTDPNRPLFGKDVRAAEGKGADAKSGDGKAREGEKRFSFYEILPGKEEVIDPKKALEAAKTEPKGETAKGEEPKAVPKETYFLQAGAFGSAGDADNQKAKLALMGFEARVESVEVEGKGTMHRVRLGPYGKLDDINRVRATLAQNGVDASLIRLKDPQKP